MKKIFVVLSQELNGKYFAVPDTIPVGENLIAYIKRYNSNICHLCESRKQAEDIANAWNESYRQNGTALI